MIQKLREQPPTCFQLVGILATPERSHCLLHHSQASWVVTLPIVLPNNRISAMLPIASLLRYSNIGWEDYLSIESFGIDHYLHSFFIRTIPRTSERGRPKLRTVGGPPGLAFNCTLGTGRIFVTGHSPLHTSTYYRSGRRTTRSECGYQVSKSYQSNSLFTFPFLR